MPEMEDEATLDAGMMARMMPRHASEMMATAVAAAMAIMAIGTPSPVLLAVRNSPRASDMFLTSCSRSICLHMQCLC